MTHVFSPAENYIVCGRVGMTEVVPSSVKEKCFSCHYDVVVFPNSQKILTDRPELKLKIVCTSCYMSAPDKDHIQPKSLERSGAPQGMVDMLRRR
jgi:hypothetical protein